MDLKREHRVEEGLELINLLLQPLDRLELLLIAAINFSVNGVLHKVVHDVRRQETASELTSH
jgi:hypothetical protein